MKKHASLSSGDSQVLSRILDPESAPTAGIVIVSNLPADQHFNDPALLSLLKATELEAIKDVERVQPGLKRDVVGGRECGRMNARHQCANREDCAGTEQQIHARTHTQDRFRPARENCGDALYSGQRPGRRKSMELRGVVRVLI